jgi:N-methylhydantoinase A
VLGYLSADNFLGGSMRLDAGRARAAIKEKIAAPLALPVEQAAEGIIRIIDVKMEEAIKAISTMRGHDLRDFMLLAFGGAGPAHSGRIARDLGLAGVIVPPYPGVFSVTGLQVSDVKHDYVRSKMTPIAELTVNDMEEMLARLEGEALADLRRDGFAPAEIRLDRAVDMRYAGQGYEVAVACGADVLGDGGGGGGGAGGGGLDRLRRNFDARHQSMFGHVAPHEPVEVVSYRLHAIGLVPAPRVQKFAPAGMALAQALREYRQVRFDGENIACPVYQRERLDVGLVLAGPAIIDQFDSTTVVSPGQTARVDGWKNLIIAADAPDGAP